MKRALLILCLLQTVGSTSLLQAQTWNQFMLATNNYWSYVACSADGTTVFALQNDSWKNVYGVYKSTNSGVSWFITLAQTNVHYYGLTASADGRRVAFATNKGLFSSTNAGDTWFPVGPTNTIWWGLSGSPDGTKLWAIKDLDSGLGLFTSSDAGNTWVTLTNKLGYGYGGSFAVSTDGTKIIAEISGGSFRVTNNGEAWYPGISRSTNGGVSWYLLTNSPQANSSGLPSQNIDCSADGSKIVLAPCSKNSDLSTLSAIFLSTNSGESWVKASAPSNLWKSASMSADGSRILAAAGYSSHGSNACIAVSDDSGVTWAITALTNQDIVSSDCSADGSKMYVGSGWVWFIETGRIYRRYAPFKPTLKLSMTNGNSSVAWLASSTNVVLQQSADLQNWSAVSAQPVFNFTNLQNEVTAPTVPLTNQLFYRLAQP